MISCIVWFIRYDLIADIIAGSGNVASFQPIRYIIKYMTRIPVVEITPKRAISRDFISITSAQEARQKKMYGIRVVITEIVASWAKWLEKSRRAALIPHAAMSATAGVPLLFRSWIFGMEN